MPTVSISPTSLSVSCGTNTIPTTFTANILSGTNCAINYRWNVGNGWKRDGILVTAPFTTSSPTITLEGFSPTILPSSVSVQVFLNNVGQSIQTCTVNPDAFISPATISGLNSSCLGTSNIYNLTSLGVGNLVTWNVSNTSLATLSAATQSQVTVTSINDGLATLTATITNPCGQTTTKNFNIFVGSPIITAYTIQGINSVSIGNSSFYSVNAPINTATSPSYSWSIVADNSSCINATTGLGTPGSILPFITSGGTSKEVLVNWGRCTGNYRLRCRVQTACSQTVFYDDKVVTVSDFSASNPCLSRIVLSPNPLKSNNGGLILNIAQPVPIPGCELNRITKTEIKTIEIYNLQAKLIYSGKYNSESNELSNLNLVKGNYFVHALSSDGQVFKEKLIVE